jgi:hypothetical protein
MLPDGSGRIVVQLKKRLVVGRLECVVHLKLHRLVVFDQLLWRIAERLRACSVYIFPALLIIVSLGTVKLGLTIVH